MVLLIDAIRKTGPKTNYKYKNPEMLRVFILRNWF